MGTRLIVAALMTLLAGCASTEPLPGRETNYGQNNAGAFNTAVYVNTQTGDIKHCDNTLAAWVSAGAYQARVTTCPAAQPAGLRGGGALSRGGPVGPRALPQLGSLQLPRRKATGVKVEDSQVRFLDGIAEELELDLGLIMTDR
jgi:hypothetical protein